MLTRRVLSFAQSIPTICGDATLPVTVELQGILPLIDPAVLGSDVENANAADSLTTPFVAVSLSVADIAVANGMRVLLSASVSLGGR